MMIAPLESGLRSVFENSDDRAVSPVIGVILMVAITVILAAVIATFVLDLGGDQQQAPQASFSLDGTTITHEGGDNIPAGQLSIEGASTASGASWGDGSDPVTAGEGIELAADPGTTTVRVVWNGPGGQSATLATLND